MRLVLYVFFKVFITLVYCLKKETPTLIERKRKWLFQLIVIIIIIIFFFFNLNLKADY